MISSLKLKKVKDKVVEDVSVSMYECGIMIESRHIHPLLL